MAVPLVPPPASREPFVVAPEPVSAPAAPQIAEPEIAAVPQPVPVAPLYEAQVFERPVPAEPPPMLVPERLGHAGMVAALMAPLETAALEEAQIGGFYIISVSTAGMQGGTVAAAAGRLSPRHGRANRPASAAGIPRARAQGAPAEGVGVYHPACFPWERTTDETRRVPSAGGLAPNLVGGGINTGRPGPARLQVERTAARLSVA